MKTTPHAAPLGLRLLLVALGLVAMTACERRLDSTKAPKQQVSSTTVTTTTTTTTPSSGNLIGTPPAPPTTTEGSPPETTPVSPGQAPGTVASSDSQRELTKSQESSAMPLPGQPNDHSNEAPDASQRTGQSNPQSTK